MQYPLSSRPLSKLAKLAESEHQSAIGAVMDALKHAKVAGDLLLEAKSQVQHGEWLPWIADNLSFTDRTAQAYMRIAMKWGEIANTKHAADLSISGALHLLSTSSEDYILHSSQSVEWWTPAHYVNLARNVMGSVDLDPASCDTANETVMATTYFDFQDDGLSLPWHGNVWLNPPYGRQAPKWVEHLLEQSLAGEVKQAVVPLSLSTVSTVWFSPLWDYPLCFTDHRIDFSSPVGSQRGGSPGGSVFVYLGDDEQAFAREFSKVGHVVRKYSASQGQLA